MDVAHMLIRENERLRELVKKLLDKLDVAAAYAEGLPAEEQAEEPSNHDVVNHPAHYTAGGVECIDAIEAATTGLTGGQAYNTGAAIKYLWRWSRKGGAEDLRKARWYVERLIKDVEAVDGGESAG